MEILLCSSAYLAITLPSCSAFSLKSGLDLSTAVGRTEIACVCRACVKLAVLRLEMDRVGKQDRLDGSRSDRRRLRNSILEGAHPHDAISSFVNVGRDDNLGPNFTMHQKSSFLRKGWLQRKSGGLLPAGIEHQ